MNQELNILVVDDFIAIRTIVKTKLRNMGYSNVSEACDGRIALDILKNKEIDLVISDWNMPKMTGYELLKAVRDDTKLKNILFIMVTAEANEENINMAMKLKVDQFILKPFTLAILEEKIKNLVH